MSEIERVFLERIQGEPDEALHKLAYADWLREDGREDLAYAFEWMARRKIHPMMTISTGAYWWFKTNKRNKTMKSIRHYLPSTVFLAIERKRDSIRHGGQFPFMTACKALAKALKACKEDSSW